MKGEKMTINLRYSDAGTPYIEIGDLGSFIFSKITSHPDKGYKYMCFNHTYDDAIQVKNGNERKTVLVHTNDSHTVNMFLERKPATPTAKAYGLPHGTLPSRMKDYFKKVLKPFIDDEGYIHFRDIKSIGKKIEGKDIEKILDKVQKKRKRRKKKSKK